MDMDIEKTMRFMLDMQAKHEAWLQKHEEAMKRHEEAIVQIEAAGRENDRRIAQLADVSLSIARSVEQNSSSIKELREAQAASEYKLNALIDTVDKIVRKNGHNNKKS